MEKQESDFLKVEDKVPKKTFLFYFVIFVFSSITLFFIAITAVLIGEIFGIKPGRYVIGLLVFISVKLIWNIVTKLFSKNSKKKFLKIILIFIGITIACVIMVIIGVSLDDTKQKNIKNYDNEEIKEIVIDKSEDNSEIVDNMYRNNKYGFRIKFPKGWKIEVGDGKHIVQKAILDSGSIMVTVFQLDLAGENGFSSIKDFGPAKEYIDSIMEGITEKFSDVKILDYGETRIDNQPTYWVEYSATSQVLDYTIKTTNISYSLAKEDTIYSINGGSWTDEYEKMKPEIIKSVVTFVLEN